MLESSPHYAVHGAGELGRLIRIEQEQGGIYWQSLWEGGSQGVDWVEWEADSD